jgi:uncharacterized protein YndB with AHSA1/START domain
MISNDKTMTITLNRTIPASPAEVYDAWLDSATPGTPWSRAECEKVILDPKIDGVFYFRRAKDERVKYPHFGRFVALEPGKKIEYTWMSPFTHGAESLVTVELESQGDDTLLQLRHSKLPDDEMGHMHDSGWTSILGGFVERFLARRKR